MLSKKITLRRDVRSYISTFFIAFTSFTVLSGCTPTKKLAVPTTPLPKGTIVATDNCGIQECHGTTLTCGSNVPEMCTMQYEIGDRCRQYFFCSVLGGTCKADPSQKFQQCVQCASQCKSQYPNDSVNMMECESSC